MRFVPVGAFDDTLWLEPEHQLAPGKSQRIAQGFEPGRVQVRLDPPVADVRCPTALPIPFGVNPVVFDWQLMLDELLNVVQVHLGAGAAPVAAGDRSQQGLAAAPGAVMCQDELAQEVLAPPAVSLVEEQQDPRRADGLAGE